jgi:FHS family L-fucose permease-like MFS transporter
LKAVTRHYLIPFILVTTMFFAWGVANNMTDTLLAAFKRIMSMSDFQTSWIQLAFYGSYFCLALPAAMLIRRFSYKTGIMVGLGLFILGSVLFYPASQTMVYGHFLTALFVLAGGLSFLETTANPYILAMGEESTSIQRLNLAQSFNPIGSITGVLLSKFFILDKLNTADALTRQNLSAVELEGIQRAELSAVMGPYVSVAAVLFVLWLIIYFTKMPTGIMSDRNFNLGETLKRLFNRVNYRRGVIAQFFYMGAQIGIWSFTIRYVMQELNVMESDASSYYLAALILFTISRFVFTGLLERYKAGTLLAIAAFGGASFLLISIFAGGWIGVIALVAISAGLSLMFPTIFGLALLGLGEDKKMAGSGLIMAMLGGALLPAVQGLVSDSFNSIQLSFIIPLICLVMVGLYGLSSLKAIHE